MSPDLVRILACIAAEQARVAAMQAENAVRAANNEAPAYAGDQFYYVAAELDRLSVQAANCL